MEEKELSDNKDQLVEIFESEHILNIKEAIEEFPPAHVVEILIEKDDIEIIQTLKSLDVELSGKIFSYFPIDKQYELVFL